MGKNKDARIKIEGMQYQIDVHLEKVKNELKKEVPNYGDIHHWEAEINAWQTRIAKLQKRING